MPVLLLAQGDAAAKDLLRNAIEARYGTRPPALDSLKIDFKGRSRVKVGPVKTWVPLDMTAYFRFPTAMRWDFVVRPMGLAVQRGVEAYDGETYRTVRGSKAATVVTDEATVQSMRRRLWAVASILLTPLSDLYVQLDAISEQQFGATNTRLDDRAEVTLRPDHTMEQVTVTCLNPDSGKDAQYAVQITEALVTIGDLILPARLSMSWDGQPSFEVEPTQIESNPDIPDQVFQLADETDA